MKVEHNLQPGDTFKFKFTDRDEYYIGTIESIYFIGEDYEIQFSYKYGVSDRSTIISGEGFKKVFRNIINNNA